MTKKYKPAPSNNYNKPDKEVQKFKNLYPTTRNTLLAPMFNLSIHQVNRWGSILRLNKRHVERSRRKKKCQRCKETKDLSMSYFTDDDNVCIKCIRKEEPSLKARRVFNPITHRIELNQDTPDWWIKSNQKLIELEHNKK